MQEPVLAGCFKTGQELSNPLLRPGNTNCGGCGMSVTWNILSHARGQRNLQVVIPACCGIVTAGHYPVSSYGAPTVASTFASSAAVAAGLAHVAAMNGEDQRVICFAGDGGTYDIGMAALSGAAERNDDILYICYDNEIYGNTGGQRSSATPFGATTTTTPGGKKLQKKDITAIMAAHRIPYVASVSLAHLADTRRKMEQALDMRGFRFLHVFAPCPTGWKSEQSEGIELIRLAVDSGLFPVMEIFDGLETKINIEPSMSDAALEKYFSSQGRFKKNKVNITEIRAAINANWKRLRHSTA